MPLSLPLLVGHAVVLNVPKLGQKLIKSQVFLFILPYLLRFVYTLFNVDVESFLITKCRFLAHVPSVEIVVFFKRSEHLLILVHPAIHILHVSWQIVDFLGSCALLFVANATSVKPHRLLDLPDSKLPRNELVLVIGLKLLLRAGVFLIK